MSTGTALSAVTPTSNVVQLIEVRLRHRLDEMAGYIDEAFHSFSYDRTYWIVMAKMVARQVADPSAVRRPLGASLRTGRYGGLSVVANLLSPVKKDAKRFITEYAELTWHARDLLDGVSPFADEMLHADFQDAYCRLAKSLNKEGCLKESNMR